MKLAIIDIDRVIVDPTKRFEAATEDGKINWEKALSSELLHLDEIMPHAVEHLAVIRQRYDQLILLTSRYDHMETATGQWLAEHGISSNLVDAIITKPWDKRYIKTKVWKAERILKLLQEFSQVDLWQQSKPDPVTELLIAEDEESNQQEISQEVARWIMPHRQMRARYFMSLQEAVRKLAHDDEELAALPDIPF